MEPYDPRRERQGFEKGTEPWTSAAGAGLAVGGGLVVLLGAITLVAFLVIALTGVLPLWLSALLVAGVLLAGGAGLAWVGLQRFKKAHGLTRTLQNLAELWRGVSGGMGMRAEGLSGSTMAAPARSEAMMGAERPDMAGSDEGLDRAESLASPTGSRIPPMPPLDDVSTKLH